MLRLLAEAHLSRLVVRGKWDEEESAQHGAEHVPGLRELVARHTAEAVRQLLPRNRQCSQSHR
jgi:hypothetical protein